MVAMINEKKLGTVLIVDDKPDNIRVLASILNDEGHKIRAATSGRQALDTIEKDIPDVILLDIRMHDMNGYETCEILKKQEHTKDIPIIFISAANETEDKVEAFRVGGVDYITKPFQLEEVIARVDTQLRLYQLQNQLKEQAIMDSLTGLYNRRHMDSVLNQASRYLRGKEQGIGIMMIDVDHFKKFNDTHGHDAGDTLLEKLATKFLENCRVSDIAFRYGGEEFLLFLPDISIEILEKKAQNLLQTINDFGVEYNKTLLNVTVSIGITVFEKNNGSIFQAVKNGDKALFKAKENGRNTVVIYNGH